MKSPVVMIGIGQMGGVFARGFLRAGHPVIPVVRGMSMRGISEQVEDPALALVAVAEEDLQGVLGHIPASWKNKIALIQNELLPATWQAHGIVDPTVITVWFEKKFRQPIKPLIPSRIFGPQAARLAEALAALKLESNILKSDEELVAALVMKNLYILTVNIAGLQGADTVGGLLAEHRSLTEEVFNDVFDLQQTLTGRTFNREVMWQEMVEIMAADPDHGSRGRSAPQRLKRALKQGASAGLELAALRAVLEKSVKS